jgi:AcrR family transcriptional regulator
MNEKFFNLPKEKRRNIINASLYVFAGSEYKKAGTDEIAQRAGISKGLLFHYFGNKKELYLYIYRYAVDYILRQFSSGNGSAETDFFKMLNDGYKCKIQVYSEHPDIMNFMVRSYFEDNPEIKQYIDKNFGGLKKDFASDFLSRADASRFREGISPAEVFDMIRWMAEGFIHSRTPGQLTDPEAMSGEFLDKLELLRRLVYKAEFV